MIIQKCRISLEILLGTIPNHFQQLKMLDQKDALACWQFQSPNHRVTVAMVHTSEASSILEWVKCIFRQWCMPQFNSCHTNLQMWLNFKLSMKCCRKKIWLHTFCSQEAIPQTVISAEKPDNLGPLRQRTLSPINRSGKRNYHATRTSRTMNLLTLE